MQTGDHTSDHALSRFSGNAAVQNAVLAYANNRGTQSAIKSALRTAGAKESEISKINFKKSFFPKREFGL